MYNMSHVHVQHIHAHVLDWTLACGDLTFAFWASRRADDAARVRSVGRESDGEARRVCGVLRCGLWNFFVPVARPLALRRKSAGQAGSQCSICF